MLIMLQGTFIATVGALCVAVSQFYPDKVCPLTTYPRSSTAMMTNMSKPSVPRTFPDGLEKELGGPRAVRAAKTIDDDAAIISGGSRSSIDGPTLGEVL